MLGVEDLQTTGRQRGANDVAGQLLQAGAVRGFDTRGCVQ